MINYVCLYGYMYKSFQFPHINAHVSYLLNWPLNTRLMGCYTNRWQGFLDLVFLTQIRWSSSLTFTDPRNKYATRHPSKDIAQPAQPMDINTLHNVQVVEKLIQFTIGANAKIIANSYWTENLMEDFFHFRSNKSTHYILDYGDFRMLLLRRLICVHMSAYDTRTVQLKVVCRTLLHQQCRWGCLSKEITET